MYNLKYDFVVAKWDLDFIYIATGRLDVILRYVV